MVLNNSSGAVTPPKPTWSQVVSGNTITGTFGTNLAAFDQFLGVRYWNAMGNQMRLMQGSNPTTIAHKATYNYYLNPGNNYALSMSNQSVLINTGGTATAGMFDYHAANNYQLTTFDADHDVYSANCSNSYGNTAWWYGACWSGSFWGGGDSGGYTNNPYWTSSGGEYFSWGGIWVRDPAEITTGSYLRDSSSMVVNGTPGGTSIVDGFYGKARNFNGTSDYINTPWTGSLPNWTIEAWISDNGTRTNYRAIVQTQDPNVSGQSDHALYIYPSASNNVFAF